MVLNPCMDLIIIVIEIYVEKIKARYKVRAISTSYHSLREQ